ncbi:hypothetical protein ACU3L3_12490 [Priestia endophytica]|jgi:hypothetical protein|uniref:Uncharacterized protein n=1 Tax=Priestia endophytica DSM 13796 TaxID=1121089 RepID=A0A1I6BAF6_9BACI|nr:hypothetical protein [Priestia endophytica]KYG26113.1 hypothetical protein AZF06_16395 [Priestia endophytica]MBG9813737.1 hypothetical protein [Priestia endophytica]RAS73132.1 hypothetical protein A4R27_25415 [Priestia endophytica]SFQ77910.1 hypothetical protein SAMN02745910_03374 [Priestia endophytica DSM 13796]
MKWIAPILVIIINIALFPIAVLIGAFGGNILGFCLGIAYILGPPNLIFLIIYLGIKRADKENKSVPNHK